MKRKCFTPLRHLGIYANEFSTEDSFKQNLTVGSLLGLSFKPCQLAFKRGAIQMICNFTVEHCKPAIRQTNSEKKANNAF